MPTFVEQTGLRAMAGIDQKDSTPDIMSSVLTGLADGDVIIAHETYTDPEKIRRYGRTIFNDGEVAQNILTAAIQNGTRHGAIYDLQSMAADYFDAYDCPVPDEPTESAIRIFPEAIIVDENPLLLKIPPAVVMDFAPGLMGRSIIEDQIDFCDRGTQPFGYMPFVRLPFTNKLLLHTYNDQIRPDGDEYVLKEAYYLGHEKGVAAGTDEVIGKLRDRGHPSDVADIIICNGGAHASEEDLRHGVYNAYKLLNEFGMFLIRSFANPSESELGTDKIAGWAYEAGFDERLSIVYSAVSHIGALAMSGLGNLREMKSIILAKR